MSADARDRTAGGSGQRGADSRALDAGAGNYCCFDGRVCAVSAPLWRPHSGAWRLSATLLMAAFGAAVVPEGSTTLCTRPQRLPGWQMTRPVLRGSFRKPLAAAHVLRESFRKPLDAAHLSRSLSGNLGHAAQQRGALPGNALTRDNRWAPQFRTGVRQRIYGRHSRPYAIRWSSATYLLGRAGCAGRRLFILSPLAFERGGGECFVFSALSVSQTGEVGVDRATPSGFETTTAPPPAG